LKKSGVSESLKLNMAAFRAKKIFASQRLVKIAAKFQQIYQSFQGLGTQQRYFEYNPGVLVEIGNPSRKFAVRLSCKAAEMQIF
jgi:hypothetical protein